MGNIIAKKPKSEYIYNNINIYSNRYILSNIIHVRQYNAIHTYKIKSYLDTIPYKNIQMQNIYKNILKDTFYHNIFSTENAFVLLESSKYRIAK